LAHRCKPVSC
jgi:hypothetical protein